MTTWFTSDLHVGHRRVAEIRGFETVEAHDQTLAAKWRHAVGEQDLVWVLGDLAVGRPEAALELLADLPGRKRLVSGNHDPVHPMHRDAPKWSQAYAEVFEWVTPFQRVSVHGRRVMLSHFPYERDRYEVRYLEYRLRDGGLPLLHGHTHSRERQVGREVHVGVDAWDMRPVRDSEVVEQLDLIRPQDALRA